MKELKDLKLKDKSKFSDMDESTLKTELVSAQKSLFSLKMKKESNELKQTHLIKFLRKYIARIKTVATIKGFNVC